MTIYVAPFETEISIFHLVTLFFFCATANSGTKGKESFAASQFDEMNFVVLGYIHSFNSNRRALTHKNTFFYAVALFFVCEFTAKKKRQNKETRSASSGKKREYNWFIDFIVFLLCSFFLGREKQNMRTDRKCHTATKRTVIPRCSPTQHAIVSIFCFALFAKR